MVRFDELTRSAVVRFASSKIGQLALLAVLPAIPALTQQPPRHLTRLTEPQGSVVFKVVTRTTARSSDVKDPAVLTIDPGSEDELPEGPASFEVLQDGRYVIADPLAKRLVFYTKDGRYEKQLKLDFSPDRVLALPDRRLQIHDAGTDTLYRFNESNGLIQQRGTSRGLAATGNKAEAQLLGPNLGVVKRPPTRGAAAAEIKVTFDSPGNRMVSLGSLQIEDTGITYIVFDTDRSVASVDAKKTIREYLPDGTFDLEVGNIENDGAVPLIDEFRVRNGRLFQLVTQLDVVKINYWNLKSTQTE